MKIVLILTLVLAICGIVALQASVTQVRALTLSDPWTYQAATFNPSGVKYCGGITTGNELRQGYVPAWQSEAARSTKAELLDSQ